MRLHLVRHGETDINAAGRLQGSTDSLLTDLGRRQAQDIAVASVSWRPVAIYASPLRRAYDVARQIANLTGIDATPEPRLAEMDMGALEGVTVQQMRDDWPDLYRNWRHDASSVTMPGGESLADVQQRAMSAFAEWETRHAPGNSNSQVAVAGDGDSSGAGSGGSDNSGAVAGGSAGAGDTIIAVTHNFTIRCIVAAVLQMPLANINYMELSLGSRTTITAGPRGRRLAAYNAVDHLSPSNRAAN